MNSEKRSLLVIIFSAGVLAGFAFAGLVQTGALCNLEYQEKRSIQNQALYLFNQSDEVFSTSEISRLLDARPCKVRRALTGLQEKDVIRDTQFGWERNNELQGWSRRKSCILEHEIVPGRACGVMPKSGS